MTKPPVNRRKSIVEVGFTAAEKSEVAAAATAEGLSTSTFIRMAALQLARGTA